MLHREGLVFCFLLCLLILIASCSASTTGVKSDAGPGIRMKLTVYDSGRSCPADCDAHVVMNSINNGTPNAYLPAGKSGAYNKCVSNQKCRICFDSADPGSCMTAMYRGNGAERNAFGFTPAFYEQNCSKSDIPEALAAQCSLLRRQAGKMEGRLNCFKDPGNPKCQTVMTEAKQLRDKDMPLYKACVRQGYARFNRSRPPAKQRSSDCAHQRKMAKGANGKGEKWRKLLPAGCRENTFVGRDGIDCCSGNIFHDGPLNAECISFYK